jgi:hypothetical protein
MITVQELTQLKALVDKIVADKGDADAKTQLSNVADTAAAQANAAAAQAKLDESTADALVASDFNDLKTFVDGLPNG